MHDEAKDLGVVTQPIAPGFDEVQSTNSSDEYINARIRARLR